jgi:hypothetical protein
VIARFSYRPFTLSIRFHLGTRIYKFPQEKSPMKVRIGCVVVGFLLFVLSLAAQTASGGSASSQQVPPLILFSNVATDPGGSSLSGAVNITFSLYAGQSGGAPLWTETQNNVQLDSTGHYSVQLGITKRNGVPTTLFTTGEARWLGVRIAEQGEQPRVLLLSVPYALKAGDAATIGGLPPSAFVLATPGTDATGSAGTTFSGAASSTDAPPAGSVTGSGTADFIPLWTSTSNIGNSVLFQKGSGSTAKLGINTITPATTLDVKGAGTIRGIFSLPATGAATATKGANSQPLNLAASAFNSISSTAVNQTFQWQSEPAGNNTSTPSGTLNLLFGEGATKPSETGLHIANNGQITFATGQTFPGAGDGTVTSVGSGAGLTGGPITSSGSLSIANAGVSNAMLQNPSLTVTANSPLSGGGSVSLGGSTSLGLKGCAANQILQFVSGVWACANPATGTVTSVASGLGLSGGPITGSGTLAINPSVVPQLAAANTFTANQTVSGSVTATSFTGNGSGLTNVTAVNSNELGGLASGAYAQLAAANTFTANQTVTGTITGGTSGSSSAGVLGEANASSGQTFGVGGFTASPAGYGVEGLDVASSGGTAGYFQVNTSSAIILQGNNGSTSEFSVDSAGDVYAQGVIVGGNSNSSTEGLFGEAYASSGQTYGVVGESASPTGYGVEGVNTSSGADGTLSVGLFGFSQIPQFLFGGGGVGVEGQSPYIGVLGTASNPSNEGTFFSGSPGVWGDTGGAAESGFVGVVGTADDDSAGNFFNNSPQATLFVGNDSTANSTDLVLVAQGDQEGGSCTINVSGDLHCSGSITAAVHAGGSRQVALNTISSPEHWFEDAGSGQLSNGEAVVNIEAVFGETVNTGVEYHVFLTPNGDCKGLYVSQKSPTSFVVRELGGGHSSIAFDYRIMAKRAGYEKVRLADLTEQFNKQQAYRKKMRRPQPSGVPKAGPKMPMPPVLPVRAAVQPVAARPKLSAVGR